MIFSNCDKLSICTRHFFVSFSQNDKLLPFTNLQFSRRFPPKCANHVNPYWLHTLGLWNDFDVDLSLICSNEMIWKACFDLQKRLEEEFPDIMKLGLLFETGIDACKVNDQSTYVSFQHKILQGLCCRTLYCETTQKIQERSGKQKLTLGSNYIFLELNYTNYIIRLHKCFFNSETNNYYLRLQHLFLKSFQGSLRKMFPSRKDILRHKDVIVFVCGLMTDPTPFVDYVYQTCQGRDHTDALDSLFTSQELELFSALFVESKVQLNGNYVHNKHVNYFDHKLDERKGQPLDTQMYSRSKEYIFLDLKATVDVLKEKKRDDPNESSIHIDNSGRNPDPKITKNLLATCKEISRFQPIVSLFLSNLKCEHFKQTKIFSMSKNTTSVVFHVCALPTEMNVHLQQQLSDCTGLEVICFNSTRIEDATFLDRLQDMSSLTCLELIETELSPIIGRKVCKQLKALKLLRTLWLNIPGLGAHGRYIKKALKAWGPNSGLQTLHLRNCDMPANVCSALIPHIPKNVTLLHLSGNTLTGCLSQFTELPKLAFLALSRGSLIQDDIEHLTRLICGNNFPRRADLYLSQNNLDKVYGTLSNMIKQSGARHQRDLGITLVRNFSTEIQNELKQLCKGKKVYLMFWGYS